MAAVAWGISLFVGPLTPLISRTDVAIAARDVALGIGLAAVVVGATWVTGRRFEWGRRLEEEFEHLLGPLTSWEVLHLAVFSGLAEELFFRGALQPHLGYVTTALLFGLFHVGPGPTFVSWTLFALAVGFLFGGAVALTGSLLPAIVAHVGVNFVNLHRLRRRDDTRGGGGRGGPEERLPRD